MTDGPGQAAEPLTRRERQVLALLADGYSAPEIAEKLTLAVSSVKTHVAHLYAKLGVSGKRQALTRAHELGLLASGPRADEPGRLAPPPAAASAPLPGSALAGASSPRLSGTVTFLFTDIESSTQLLERLRDDYATVLAQQRDLLRASFAAHRGQEMDTQGDAFFAAFPRAQDAVACAAATQRALAAHAWPNGVRVRVRMGLHTGEPVIGSTGYVGLDVHRAARIAAAGHGGQVLLSQATRELVYQDLPPGTSLRKLGEYMLKDFHVTSAIWQLEVAGLPADFPHLRAPEAAEHLLQGQPALPIQVTRFFGHEADLVQLKAMLADWRLVTLTGPGGVGKTRLSLRVAEELAPGFPNGLWFVELASLSDPARVSTEIAAALGVPESSTEPLSDRLAAFLAERQSLLILDNCEHLLAACAWLADHLLRACPRLRIMTTSREALGIAGEAVFVVPSLPFPDPQRVRDSTSLDEYTALSLFVDRARAVQPGFALTAQNARGVARVCQRLDGIPLALELAAARTRLLDVDALADRLDDAFRLLTGGSRTALPRHQTLRAAIDWSYQLLTEPERLLLRRLAVFAGGCTLEAAEVVCSDDPGAAAIRPRPAASLPTADVFDRLAALVDKSMIVATTLPGQATRYHQLEMVRQYAGEKLDASGETDGLRQRHMQYFSHLAEANRRALLGKERPQTLKRFEAEVDNLRLALVWAFRDPADALPGIAVAVAFQPIWFVWNRNEMYQWMEKGVALLDGGAVIEPALQARFLAWASAVLWGWNYSRRLAEQSLAISRGLGPEHQEVLCWSLWVMAVGGFYMELLPEHWDEAEALLDEQSAIISRLGPDTFMEPWLYEGYNLWLRAVLANYRGQLERARAYGLESLRFFEVWGNDVHRVGPAIALGDTALRQGEYDQAHKYFELASRLMHQFRDVRENDTTVLLCETELRRGNLAEAYEYCQQYYRNSAEEFFAERLEMGARIFSRLGRFIEAAHLSGAAESISERYWRPASTRIWGPESYWGDWRVRFADVSLDALVPGWRDRPDSEAIVQAWNAGRAMTEREARAYALGLTI